MMWTAWGIHWIWMVAFWAVLIGAVVWAVVRVAPTSSPRGTDARAILDARYARGELDDDEYRQRRDELDG